MSRFPNSRLDRLRIVSIGNSLLMLEGIDFNKFESVRTKISKEFLIGKIRSRLKLDFGKRVIFKHRDRETNRKTEYRINLARKECKFSQRKAMLNWLPY